MATLSPQRRSRQPLSTIRKVPRGYMVALLVITMSVLAACGDDENGEVSAEFTGGGCVYSGPAEFELGDEFEMTVVDVAEERIDVGFGLVKVPDGTSVADVGEKGIEEVMDQEASAVDGTFVLSEVTVEGTERVMTTTLDVVGTWLVNCFVMGSGNAEGDDFPAATIEVVEKS